MAVDVKRLIQEMVVPDLQEIKAKLGTMEVEIRRLDEKIDGVEEKMGIGLKRLDEKIEGVKEDVRNLRSEFHLAIDMHERIAALEAKIGH